MKKLFFLFTFCSCFVACGTIDTKSLTTPAQSNHVDFMVLFGTDADEIPDYLSADVKSIISTKCLAAPVAAPAPAAGVSPYLVPFLAELGKYLFDRNQDKKLKSIADLKKASQSSYSGRQILPAGALSNASCLLLTRYSKENKQTNIGLTAVVKLEQIKGKAFTAMPIYLDASNAVVYTKKTQGEGEEKKAANINVSIGIVLKAIGKQDNGLPALLPVGESATSVANVVLEDNDNNSCDTERACNSTDLIAITAAGDEPVSLTMSITETGKTGIDFDQKTAEVTAIKAAFGPVIKDQLLKALDDD